MKYKDKKITPHHFYTLLSSNQARLSESENPKWSHGARCKSGGGFTLIELLVTIAIFSVITTLVFVKNNQFQSTLLLENLAYEIALSVRQAQVFGLSVREYEVSDDFDNSYGVRFNAPGTGHEQEYYIFVDSDDDGRYDEGENVETFTMQRGLRVKSICGSATNQSCESGSDLDVIQVLFKRPDPDALIFLSNGDPLVYAEIHLDNTDLPDTGERIIVIRQTGQISVQ